MVVPEEREGKTDAAMMLSRDPSKASESVSTRKAGGREAENKGTRKVDFVLQKIFSLYTLSPFHILVQNIIIINSNNNNNSKITTKNNHK